MIIENQDCRLDKDDPLFWVSAYFSEPHLQPYQVVDGGDRQLQEMIQLETQLEFQALKTFLTKGELLKQKSPTWYRHLADVARNPVFNRDDDYDT